MHSSTLVCDRNNSARCELVAKYALLAIEAPQAEKGERCRKGSSCTFPNRKLKTLKGFSSLSRLIPGRFAGLGEGHRTIDERLHRRTERFPKLGEFIFHLWWKLRMNGSPHQLALRKETQLLRQHTL